MPPLPRLRVSALADLAEQLKFVPAEAARRHLEQAESLLESVDAGQTYPEDWIIHRITGYRPELESPAIVVGAALLTDLGSLVERLSTRAHFQRSELPGWLGVAELCARWNVTRRTLERYRPLGLIGRRARNPKAPEGDGKEVLLFSPKIVERFEKSHGLRLSEAKAFSRIDDEMAARIVRRAARYRRAFRCTRGEAANRLAKRFGRSPDAVRKLIMRHDELHAAEAKPIFPEPGPATDRQSRLVERAMRWCGVGIEVAVIAKRLRKSAASVHRIAIEQRARMVRELELSGPHGPEFLKPRAEVKILAPPSVRLGLGLPGAATVTEFVERVQEAGWPDLRVERERAVALCFLKWRAAKRIEVLPAHTPSAAAVDQIITDLRWAARLKAEIVRAEGMLLLKTVETRLGKPLIELPARLAASLLEAAVEGLAGPGGAGGSGGGGVDRYDPFKGGRVAAPAGMALNRAVSRWEDGEGEALRVVAPIPPSRATRIAVDAPPVLPDWTRAVAPWQVWTEPDPRVRPLLGQLDQSTRKMLMLRYGWLEGPPTTAAELGEQFGLRPGEVTRRERQACRDLLVIARSRGAGQ